MKNINLLKKVSLLNSTGTRNFQRQKVTSVTLSSVLSFCGVLLCISLEDVLLLCPAIGFVYINSAHMLLLCVVEFVVFAFVVALWDMFVVSEGN